MAETVDKISFQIGAQGQDQVIAALAGIDKTLEQIGQETQKTAKQFEDMGSRGARSLLEISTAAAKAAGSGVGADGGMKYLKTSIVDADSALDRIGQTAGKFTSTLGSVAGTLSQVSPEFGTLAQSVGRSTAALNNMSMLFGGGAGLVAGGIVAALQILIKKFSEASDESNKLGDSLEKTLAPATQKLLAITGYDAAHQAARDADARRIAQERADKINRANLAAAMDPNSEENIRKRQAADKAILDAAEAAQSGLIGPDISAPSQKDRGGFAEFQRNQAILDRLEAADQQQRKALDSERYGNAISEKKKALDEFARTQQRQFDEDVRAYKARDKEFERIDKQTERRWQSLRQVGAQAMEGVGTAGIQALNSLAKGQKITAKEIVAGIGDQMVADGTHWLFQGLAMSANPLTPGLGAPLMEIGAAEIAAGLTLGAATRSGAPGGASGGGGKRSGPGFYGDRYYDERPSAIEPSARLSDSATPAGDTIIINQNNLVPDAHAGVRVTQAMREAKRQGLV